MSKLEWRFAGLSFLLIWTAVVLAPLWQNLRIGPAKPDVITVTLICCALLSNRIVGTVLGFIAGMMLGSLVNSTITELCISRILTGFGAGWVPSWVVRGHLMTAVFVVIIGTLFAETVYLLMHPGTLKVLEWLEVTVTKAAYNGVVAVPMYALLGRLAPPIQS